LCLKANIATFRPQMLVLCCHLEEKCWSPFRVCTAGDCGIRVAGNGSRALGLRFFFGEALGSNPKWDTCYP
jgi:hypothetical protein